MNSISPPPDPKTTIFVIRSGNAVWDSYLIYYIYAFSHLI